MARAGLSSDGAYLVRPDGYIATVETKVRAGRIAAYLDAHNITPREISTRKQNNHRSSD
jgi:hypothetical protein